MLKLKKEHRYFELHSDCISLDLLPHLSKIADKNMSKKYFAKWNWYLLQMINCLDIFLTTINPAIKQQRWNGKRFISLIKRKTIIFRSLSLSVFIRRNNDLTQPNYHISGVGNYILDLFTKSTLWVLSWLLNMFLFI